MENVKTSISQIVKLVGGEENIKSASHCVTRLRLILKDESLINIEELEQVDIVKGCFLTGGQFQIVIGPGVEKVYKVFIEQTQVAEVSKEELKAEGTKQQNTLQRLVRMLGDIFIPLLPAIVASGLLMGVNNMISNPGIFYEASVLETFPQISGLAGMINLIANTAFTFLPALVGWSAVKKFGGNPVLGIVLGLILVHPDLMSTWEFAADPTQAPTWNIFGLQINQVGYQGQVLPVIAAAYVLTFLELKLKKWLPDVFELVLAAPIAVLLTGIITFAFIGPLTMAGSNLITNSVVALFDINPILAGLIYGVISPPLVITGMHHLFLGVNLQMAGSLGYVTLWPIGETATFAQGIACLTMFAILRKKNKKQSSICITSTVSAWLGITEPAIYGVNLRYRFPFIAVMVGSGIGSAFLSFSGVRATSVGVGGIFSFLSVFPEYWPSYFIGMVLTGAITVGLTLFFFKAKMFGAKETNA